jgi:hypothetical protein
MPISPPLRSTAVVAQNMRRSVAVLLFGVIALFAQVDFEQNQYLQQELFERSSESEPYSNADLTLFLHEKALQQRVVASIEGQGDVAKANTQPPPVWLPLVSITPTQAIISGLQGHVETTFFSPCLCVSNHTPRAPPRV